MLQIETLRGGAGLLILLAFLAGRAPQLLNETRLVYDLSFLEKNDVSLYERHFRPAKALLPSSGEVGYVTRIASDSLLLDGDAARGYYLTQYALAPLIVANHSNHRWVVGNFLDAPDRAAEVDLAIEQDFKNGVFLFQGRP